MSNLTTDDFESLLDNIPSYVFVTESDSLDVIYSNNIFKKHFMGDANSKCYDKIKRLINSQLSLNNLIKGIDFYCDDYNKWLKIYERTIPFASNIEARLFTMEDITDKIEFEKARLHFQKPLFLCI